MGILNVTPDSFSDGGAWLEPDKALGHARSMLAQGADIIDVGGESTRPGADTVDAATELQRVIPIVERLRRACPDALISVDTSKPEVMQAALAAGAHMINDVRALQVPGALDIVARDECAVCLMHMQGDPGTMQQQPVYGDVVTEVRQFLAQRVAACREAGIEMERLVVDPGFGFGKTLTHNIRLLAELGRLRVEGLPVLAGVSRKRMLAELLGYDRRSPVAWREAAGTAAALVAVQRGAGIVRTHDVAPVRDALRLWQAVAQMDNQMEQA